MKEGKQAIEFRAALAISMLSTCSGDGFDAEQCRRYDTCFESGDGTEVVCEIVRRAKADARIAALLTAAPACRYVPLEDWLKTAERQEP